MMQSVWRKRGETLIGLDRFLRRELSAINNSCGRRPDGLSAERAGWLLAPAPSRLAARTGTRLRRAAWRDENQRGAHHHGPAPCPAGAVGPSVSGVLRGRLWEARESGLDGGWGAL